MIGDLHLKTPDYLSAATAYERWAEESNDPQAWLCWAHARLQADPQAAAEVVTTITKRVTSTGPWAHAKLINQVMTALRHAGQEAACLRFLLPMRDSWNAAPLYQLLFTQLVTTDWRSARKTAALLLERQGLRLNFEIHTRLVDAAVAIQLGDKPPGLVKVSELAQRDGVLPHVAVGFAYLGGEITAEDAEARSTTLPVGALWRYYRGLKAMAMGDHEQATKNFTEVVHQFPHEMEGIAARDFLLWLQKVGADPSARTPRNWPYASPTYPATPIPVEPPAPGANDF